MTMYTRMNVRRRIAAALTGVLALSAGTLALDTDSGTPASAAAEPVRAFRVAKVLTMDEDDRVINNAVVIVRGSRIEALGRAKDTPIPDGAEVIDMPDAWLVPGFVEGHNHTAGSLSDLNDGVYLTNPGLRTLETIVPETENVKRARMGGVTTALLIPGSGNNMSGFGSVVKFAGDTVDEMLIKSPGSIKIAQAGNPERYWWGVGRSMMYYNLRTTLHKALDYHKAWEAYESGEGPRPDFDPTYDEFRGLFRREFIASVHTQQFQLVMSTIDMLARKLNIRTVLDHSTFDAWKNARVVLEIGEDNVITICGPRTLFLDNTQRRVNGIAIRWRQGGLTKVGINTDAPVIPQEELPYQAAMNCYYGLKTYDAIAGLTRIPAEALMVEDRVGRIKPGFDADFGIWSGDPIDPRSTCWLTIINGKIAQDGRTDRRF